MKSFLKKNRAYILGIIIVLIAFLLRFVNLNTLPVFADEAIYIRWAQVMKAEETLRFLPLSDGKEPLFMWAMIPLFKVFSDPLIAGRTLSVFCGFVNMTGVAVLAYLLFRNKKIAVISAFLYALSPFSFFFDRMALVDPMLSMFGVWTFVFSYLSVKYKRYDFAMLAGFTLGGAWLTKSSALFFAIILPSLWFFADWKKGLKENVPVFLKSFSLSLVTILIGYGFYNILRLGPNFHLIASRNLDYVYPLSHIFERPLDPLWVFLKASFSWIWAMGPWPVILLAIAGTIVNFKKYRKEILVLVVWFLLPIIIQSEFAKSFTARYILFTIPYLFILAGSFFALKEKNLQRYISYILLVLFLIVSLIFNKNILTNPAAANLPRSERSGYLEEWTAGQGIAETAGFLVKEQEKNPGDKIIVGTEGYFGTLPDGLQFYLNNHPEITVIGVGLGFDQVPSPLLNAKKAGDKVFFLVNKSRFNGDANRLGLILVKDFPKAEKPDGTQDSLLLFELSGVKGVNK